MKVILGDVADVGEDDDEDEDEDEDEHSISFLWTAGDPGKDRLAEHLTSAGCSL